MQSQDRALHYSASCGKNCSRQATGIIQTCGWADHCWKIVLKYGPNPMAMFSAIYNPNGNLNSNPNYNPYPLSVHMSRQWRNQCGAHAYPTLARVGREIRTNSKFFLRSRGGGSRLRMSLKVYRTSSMNTSRKCVCLCPLQILYAYLASAPRPPPGLYLWTPLEDFCGCAPDLLCQHTSKSWLRHCIQTSALYQWPSR